MGEKCFNHRILNNLNFLAMTMLLCSIATGKDIFWNGICSTFNRTNQKFEIMSETFKVGDHVKWNSEAGYVTGKIIKVHKSDFDYKGHTHRASSEHPQYEIKSDKTDHIATHRGEVLKKL